MFFTVIIKFAVAILETAKRLLHKTFIFYLRIWNFLLVGTIKILFLLWRSPRHVFFLVKLDPNDLLRLLALAQLQHSAETQFIMQMKRRSLGSQILLILLILFAPGQIKRAAESKKVSALSRLNNSQITAPLSLIAPRGAFGLQMPDKRRNATIERQANNGAPSFFLSTWIIQMRLIRARVHPLSRATNKG